MYRSSTLKNSKISKKQLSAAIALVLALAFAASFVTALPIAFGAVKISMTALSWVGPNPVGINQAMLIQGSVYPAPDYAIDLTFRITKPDGSITDIVKTGSIRAQAYFDYTPDQLGTWRLSVSWAGDATHKSASASTTWTVQAASVPPLTKIKTYAYISSIPKTVAQIGQAVYLIGWVTPPSEISGSLFEPDYQFVVTKPSGATVTIIRAPDSTAAIGIGVTCDELGTWSAEVSWAGDKLHEGCVSAPVTWTVQTEAVPTIPQEPLPTGHWTYPISAEYYEWYQIAGSWPMANYDAARTNFNPYSKAPNTAHILWKKSVERGGIIGETGYTTPLQAVPNTRSEAVASFGRIYYRYSDGSGSTLQPVVICLDQYSGETLWESHLAPVGAGGGGILAIEVSTKLKEDPKVMQRANAKFSLWVIGGGGLWELDPLTGLTLYNLVNPSLSGIYNDGAIYLTNFNMTANAAQTGVMTKWNTAYKDVEWTAPIPTYNFINDDIIFRGVQGGGGIPYGQQIWTWNATTGEPIVQGAIVDVYSSESAGRTTMAYGKWYFHSSTDLKVHAVDLLTGKEVWASTPNEAPWGTFGSYVAAAGYGNYYQGTWDGYLSCYDAATGATKWRTFLGTNPDNAMDANVPWGVPSIADGKIFITSGEHTPPNPFPRGNRLFCLNAYTGDILWSVPFMNGYSGFATPSSGISSGMLYGFNNYDGCLYSFGKGDSKTTVTAPLTSVPSGTGVLIQGFVLDQSAGAKDTPCVSDASQESWMQYLYQNKPNPGNATGVPVHLVAIDSIGTVIDIGHATSDSSGHYSYIWTPPAPDKYTIVANFDGTDSYYTSYGETAVGVVPAAAAVNVPSASDVADQVVSQLPSVTGTDIAIIAAVVVAIIIGVVNLMLLLRKKQS